MSDLPTNAKKIASYRAGTLSLAALLAATGNAFAAPTPQTQPLPSSVDPSNIERHLDQQEQAPLPQNRVTIAPPPQVAANPALVNQHFVLQNVAIDGDTVFTPQELSFAYSGMIGKDISMLDAQGIAQRITSYYHNHDYVLSQAVITQGAQDGTLKIHVVEGYIANVVIEGNVGEGSYSKIVESYGEHIKAQRPIRTADLERYLLLIDDLPGASAKGVVRPSTTTPGAAELVITVNNKPFEASYTLDNRGTKYIGPWEHTGTLTANSLFGLYDRTLLRVVTTAPTTELRFFDLQHEEQIGSEGTRLVLDASHSRTEPGDALKPLDIVGDSDFFEAKLLHPFLRSRQQNIVGRVLFDVRDTDTDTFKNVNFSDDRVRVARVGGSYDFSDGLLGVNLIDAQVSKGLNIFNASHGGDLTSITNADNNFTKFNLDLTRTQPLPYNFSILAAATGQYSFEPLLPSEQFTLGGVGFGQAYDPAELSGDQGLAGKVELRYGQALGDHYLDSYQLYSYYDIGRVWLKDGGPESDDKKSLASLGGGVRLNFSPHLSSYLEVGLPLTKPASNEGDHGDGARIFFSTTARF